MSALPPPVQAVLDLFQGPLREVRFADIDAPALARLASEVEASATELAAHEATLDTLRRALAERQEQLLAVAQRALAYARVYAETDETLSAELAAIQLARPARRPKEKLAATKPEAPAVEALKETTTGAEANTAPTLPPGTPLEVSPVEEAPGTESSESDASTRQPVSRRGKRRESARVVTFDDGSA